MEGMTHSKVKQDLLKTDDKKRLMKYILNERGLGWRDLGCAFNLECHCGFRGDTTRKLCLKDIAVSYGFATDEGWNLTIVLRMDEGKVSYQVHRLVGCRRHREYWLCQCCILHCKECCISLARVG